MPNEVGSSPLRTRRCRQVLLCLTNTIGECRLSHARAPTWSYMMNRDPIRVPRTNLNPRRNPVPARRRSLPQRGTKPDTCTRAHCRNRAKVRHKRIALGQRPMPCSTHSPKSKANHRLTQRPKASGTHTKYQPECEPQSVAGT